MGRVGARVALVEVQRAELGATEAAERLCEGGVRSICVDVEGLEGWGRWCWEGWRAVVYVGKEGRDEGHEEGERRGAFAVFLFCWDLSLLMHSIGDERTRTHESQI